jgi:N-acetylglutamate synthase/N-acetylornithine aminotransferase
MLGSVASASASSASIKAAIESYGSKIDVAEGRVLTAVGEYKTTKNPSGVQSAIGESVAVLSALRSKVQHQAAGQARQDEDRGGPARVDRGLPETRHRLR